MAIVFRAAGAIQAAASGNVTPALPTGWQVDDIFVLLVSTLDNIVFTVPAGWTAIDAGTNNGTASRTGAWFRRAVGGDGAPLVTHASGSGICAVVIAYSGCTKKTDPRDVTGATSVNTPASTTLTFHATGITTTVPNTMVLCLGGIGGKNVNAQSYTGSPTPTERVDGPNTTNRPGLDIAEFAQASAGGTGARSCSITSFVSNGILVAFAPVVVYDETGKAQVILAVQVKTDGQSMAETTKAQIILAAQARIDTQVIGELSKTQVILAVQTESDGFVFIETGLAEVILAAQSAVDNLIAGETGKTQIVLANQAEADSMAITELGKEQIVLAAQGKTDVAGYKELDLSQTILAYQMLTDHLVSMDALQETILVAQNQQEALVLAETGKEQSVLVAQEETDVLIPGGSSAKNLYGGGWANANRFDRRGNP